jgi:putative FmdB family regulatory protein
MPNYQYRCLNCRKRFEVFMMYSEYGQKKVQCTHCGSENIQRRIGRIRIAKSEDSRMEDMTDPSSLEGLEDDPQALGRMMRKMSSEMGEDMGPEFDEMVDRLEKGQSPEEIEKALPELAGDEGMGGMGGMGMGDSAEWSSGDDF